MGPVFEHGLVDALGLAQIGAPIAGDPGEEKMAMAALDDVDGVDLHIAQMFDGGRRRGGASPNGAASVEPLAPARSGGPGFGQGKGFSRRVIARQSSWIAAGKVRERPSAELELVDVLADGNAVMPPSARGTNRILLTESPMSSFAQVLPPSLVA